MVMVSFPLIVQLCLPWSFLSNTLWYMGAISYFLSFINGGNYSSFSPFYELTNFFIKCVHKLLQPWSTVTQLKLDKMSIFWLIKAE